MKHYENIIIGAGISGLGASYALREHGIESVILEKDNTYGGLAGNFEIANGFRFDRFVHFSFTENEQVNRIFSKSTGNEIIRHTPNPFNIYHGKWIKHPAQNNLYPLDDQEKELILKDFRDRPKNWSQDNISDYEQWLRLQFGNAFAEKFPMVYTEKYWMVEARNLETKWVGKRLYQPSLAEVIEGAKSSDTPLTYYAKEMRYPAKGGFKQFLKSLADDATIYYGEEVCKIDPEQKRVVTSNNNEYKYSHLISSLPLPVLINALGSVVPEDVKTACAKLKCTSGYQISIALKSKNIPPYLWFYIYDKDILPARVYSPSLKSPDNVPEGCSSLQLEVYCKENEFSKEELLEQSVKPLINLGVIRKEDIIEIDIRFEPWANVIFDHNIYGARKEVIDYVRSIGIEPIGRFGLWDYLWTDQALLSGLNIKERLSQ